MFDPKSLDGIEIQDAIDALENTIMDEIELTPMGYHILRVNERDYTILRVILAAFVEFRKMEKENEKRLRREGR